MAIIEGDHCVEKEGDVDERGMGEKTVLYGRAKIFDKLAHVV